MTRLTRVAAPFLFCILMVPVSLFAQDAAPTTLLPDIDPQDIEIRGDFEARFPGIMRQPILGFNPRPRVFQVDPNRMPFIETPDQVVASLPITDLERPAPPPYRFYQRPERFHIWATAGIGNYMSPEADVYLEVPVASRTRIRGNFHNLSTGDYLDEENQVSSFRNLDGGLGITHFSGKRSRWDINFAGRSDRNYLSLQPAEPGVINEFQPDNNISDIGASIRYRNQRSALGFTEVVADINRFKADILTAPSSPQVRNISEELRYGGAIRHQRTGSKPGNVFAVSAAVNGASYDDRTLGDGNWMVANTGANFDTRLGNALRTVVGGRFFYASDAVNNNQFYLYPEVRLLYDWNMNLQLTASAEGFVRNQGYTLHSETNRKLFVYAAPEAERGMALRTGAEYQVFEGLRAQTNVSFHYYTRMSEFRELEGRANLLTYGYVGGAYKLKWDISGWYEFIPDRLEGYAGLYLQAHENGNDRRIAFTENVGLSAGGVFKYSERSRLNVWMDYTGPRTTNLGNDLNGFFLLNSRFDFWASRDIGAYVKITNLLNQSYSHWGGYHELPAQVYGGIMLKF